MSMRRAAATAAAAIAATALAAMVIHWLLTASAVAVITACALAMLTVLGGLAVVLLVPGRDDSGPWCDADEHMKPLRQGGTAEDTLTQHLSGLHHLLYHGRITENRAARLARNVHRRALRKRALRAGGPSAGTTPQGARHAAPKAQRALPRPAVPGAVRPPHISYYPPERVRRFLGNRSRATALAPLPAPPAQEEPVGEGPQDLAPAAPAETTGKPAEPLYSGDNTIWGNLKDELAGMLAGGGTA